MLEASQQGKLNYVEAMRRAIPPIFFKTAARLVQSYRTPGLPKEMESVMMANVLIVDDHKLMAETFRGMAQAENHSVSVAKSADQAIGILETGEFNLVITDGLNGDCLKVVKAAGKKGVRSIIVTTNDSLARLAKEKGIEAFDKMKSETRTALNNIFKNL